MAEKEGFEPSMELLTPYSLSRGAPSASRPLLQFVTLGDLSIDPFPRETAQRIPFLRRQVKVVLIVLCSFFMPYPLANHPLRNEFSDRSLRDEPLPRAARQFQFEPGFLLPQAL